mgnify:CR=1 FL=1|tara:strand:- start:8325 stop:8576 length:252 start_codon:yes stop_codon:yes gene_type:complete
MSLVIEKPPRVFEYKDKVIEDPNPDMSLEEVKVFLSKEHGPEIINSVFSSPQVIEIDKTNKIKYKMEGKVERYGVSHSPGTKG